MSDTGAYRVTRESNRHVRERPWKKIQGQPERGRAATVAAPEAEGAAPVAKPAPPANRMPGRAEQFVLQTAARVAGLPWLAIIFLVSIMVPITVRAGPILLLPYRLVLLLMFFPLLIRWLSGKAGPILLMDKLMMFSAAWALLALAMNHPFGQVIEPMGIHMVEFFGAYMLGRVSIQSGADFRKLARVMFLIALVLFPLAALEAVTGRPVALDLVPNSISSVTIGERWGLRRAQTFFSHPIHHGTFVSTMVGLAWFSFNYNSGFMGRAVRLGIVCICTAFSMSSGALMAMVFQLIFIGWELVMRPHPKRWTIFAWLCLIGYILVDLISTRTPFHVVVNYATFSSGSAYNRILIWNFGTDNVWANPLFGLGLNDWVRPSFMSGSVDNFWLLIAMKYGLPASLAFMTAILLIVRRVSLAPLTDLVDRASRAGYLVSLGGIVMAGATVHYWHGIGSFVLFFIGTGAWAAQSFGTPPADPDPAAETTDPAKPTLHSRRRPA